MLVSGTHDLKDGTGGSNGATMRFAPESDDPDNAGLSIIRDLYALLISLFVYVWNRLVPVKKAHPDISFADLYTAAACFGIEFLGGPKVPFNLGRTGTKRKRKKRGGGVEFGIKSYTNTYLDDADGTRCPAHGRLPDATKDAAHLREVFGKRMGFTDREIVALSGGHTLGRCHVARSGFDGPWTTHPLRFDNEYFVNLVTRTWKPKNWNGPLQFEDDETGKLMMLPTDMALLDDPSFKAVVVEYAKDESAFFRDFATAFGKLLSLGCPAQCDPNRVAPALRYNIIAILFESTLFLCVVPAIS